MAGSTYFFTFYSNVKKDNFTKLIINWKVGMAIEIMTLSREMVGERQRDSKGHDESLEVVDFRKGFRHGLDQNATDGGRHWKSCFGFSG